MLSSLYVKNYAIIDELSIEFDSGYNVITGETGAGKSILLGALGMIMGKRADKQVLYDDGNKSVVEAGFYIDKDKLALLPSSENYELESKMILRREINRSGKSRAFINDSLVTVTEMRALATALVEIHNQFDSLSIIQPEYQLSVVDAYSNIQDHLAKYREQYDRYIKSKNELDRLKRERQKSQVDLDYYLFQLADLEKTDLDDLDQNALEDELKTLNHGEEIKRVLHLVRYNGTGSDQSIENQLIEINREVQALSDLSASMHRLAQAMEEIIELVRALSDDASDQFDDLNFSPERLEEVQDSLDHIYGLQSKHRVQSMEALIEIRDNLRLKTKSNDDLEVMIRDKESQVTTLRNTLKELADELSARRLKNLPVICRKIEHMLAKMAMPNAKVRFDHQRMADFGENGIDQITLFFSANKGIEPKAVSEVASGGEISRLALCIKSLIAGHIRIDTLLFDEIDTGISGAVAVKVADILGSLADQHQIISITHSPQVAAKASRHLYVYKQDLQNRTVTRVRTLDNRERIDELAKMLSTDPPTEAARSNALELLQLARK